MLEKMLNDRMSIHYRLEQHFCFDSRGPRSVTANFTRDVQWGESVVPRFLAYDEVECRVERWDCRSDDG